MNLEEKKEELLKKNIDFEKLAEETNKKISELKQYLAIIKEQHDYNRGQLDIINNLLKDAESSS